MATTEGPSTSPATPPLRSPLHDRHVALGAKFAEFGGWEMPLEYDGVLAEHRAVRDAVGVFDVSHLGKVLVEGPGARTLVDSSLTNSLDRIGPGQAQYTLCCDAETGGIVDDLLVYLVDDEHLLLIPNASNTAEVVRRLETSSHDGITITDQHTTHAIIAVQGTRSDEVLDAVGLPTGQDYMGFAVTPYAGTDVVVCRTGYTGERGYELVVPNEAAGELWDMVLANGAAQGIAPCGLGARDTLRLEMGYPLHGQDLTPKVSPVASGLSWAVGWSKPAFWGKDALTEEKAQGPRTRLVGLTTQGRAIPRAHMRVMLTRDFPAGEITSGTFSPTLRRGIALARVSAQIEDGAELLVDVRGRPEIFTVTKPPFVPSDVREK